MATSRPARSLSLPRQALALRHLFPGTAPVISGTRLTWLGVITPTPLSRSYTVRITYRRGEYPRVVIVAPPLQSDEDGRLPHFYREGSICLHAADQWDGSMFIADTIIPWTAEWLAHYELWKRAGRWYGDEPADGETTTAVPAEDQPRNRAQRRRARRDAARRVRREQGLGRHTGPTMTSAEAVTIQPMTGQNGGAMHDPAPSAAQSS